MKSPNDIEKRLHEFGARWRELDSIAGRVIASVAADERLQASSKSNWLGELTMTQRLTLSGIGVAALTLLVMFFVLTTNSRDLMGQVASNIRQADSYSFDIVTENESPPEEIGKITNRVQYQAPGSYRFDLEFPGKMKQTRIMHHDKPGIEIDHLNKSFRILSAINTLSPLMVVGRIGQFEGQARERLGVRKIEGVEATGFLIDLKDIDPDVHDGNAEVWIDPNSKLPVLIKVNAGITPTNVQFENFKWNLDMDASVFETSPPVGYIEIPNQKADPEEQVAAIRESLELFAELSGGTYPQVQNVYGDVTRDKMLKFAGFDGKLKSEWLQDKEFRRINNATRGLGIINKIQRENSDAAYFGKTVTPSDTDRILFRWKRDDGQYEVIYGDLRGEMLTTEQLSEIESKSDD